MTSEPVTREFDRWFLHRSSEECETFSEQLLETLETFLKNGNPTEIKD